MLIKRSHHRGSAELLTRVGSAVIAVEFRADALRTVRTALMELAHAVAHEPRTNGYIVLADSAITEKRIRSEWERAAAILRPEVLARLTICLERDEKVLSIPRDPPASILSAIQDAAGAARAGAAAGTTRVDYSFVVLKVLLHQWLTSAEPVTADWLGRTAGCSYPTVARTLKELGSVIERSSDRRVRLRYFPQNEFDRLVANSAAARNTVRFADRSGQPRSPEARIRRLEKIRPEGVAIGGVLGARHYHPELDLVGTPRLDLSVQSGGAGGAGLGFIKELDPALVREDDPHKPASVVVHRVWHADPLFRPREGGLAWADPVECLLDLHEARLESQANEFLEATMRMRKNTP